jgi:hypothetical protein
MTTTNKTLVASIVVLLSGCATSYKGTVEADHAVMAFSACQQLGTQPRYIDSEDVSPVYGKRTLITVTCSDDVVISFVIKTQPKKERGI